MNDIDQAQKGDSVAACDTTSMILCTNPYCNEVFEKFRVKKYCSKACKDNHNALMREAGKKALAKGKIHAAIFENSPDRLQVVAKFLSDGKPHSTREIIRECDVCAVNAIADELREPQNGFDIDCERKGKYWYYTMLGGQSQILRLL